MSFRTALTVLAAAAGIAAFFPASAAPDATVAARYERVPAAAYAVVAVIRAKKGKEAEMRRATLPLVAQVRAEPGNLLYFLHEDRESPGSFVFYEIFSDKAAFEVHQASPHVQAWFARLPELAEGDVKVTRIEILNNRAAGGR